MGGQGCAARGHGYGPCVVRRVRHVVPSQVVPEGVDEEPEEAGLAGGGGCGWGRGPLAVAGVEVPAVGAAGEAVRGSQADHSGLGCRAGLSVVAAGERRGDMRWLVVGGTCGRTAAWEDGGWWRAHAGGSVCGACGVRVCCASAVLGGRCVDVVGVPCWYVTG